MSSRNFFDYQNASAPSGDEPGRGVAAVNNFFKVLSEEELEAFLKFAAQLSFPAGAIIQKGGVPQRALYFVISGIVKTRLLQNGVWETFQAGSCFGISSFLDADGTSMLAQADTPVDILILTHDNFIRLAAWTPRLALTLIQNLSSILVHRLNKANIAL